jgi:hypothetical protein
MNEYYFPYLNKQLGQTTTTLAILTPFILAIVLAVLGMQTLPIIFISFSFLFIFLLIKKKILKKHTKVMAISIFENGFEFDKTITNWTQIKWYRVDSDQMGNFEIIVIGLHKGKTINISCYQKSKSKLDWDSLKKDLIQKIESNTPETANYYATKAWKIVIIVFVAIWIFIPLLTYVFKKDFTRILPIYIAFIGTGLVLIGKVRNSQKK